MADNRTGLSPADIAENFRDRCGDGSVEWTYTPMQTWVLLDAADMLAENAKLRELVRDMADAIVDWYDLIDGAFACESVYVDEKFAPLFDRMRELGVEV